MSVNDKKDDFWDLSDFARKKSVTSHQAFSKSRTSAVEINDTLPEADTNDKIAIEDTVITRFVPPHSDPSASKRHIIFEYEPENPLIKKVTVYSDKEGEELFLSDNLFIRERRATLERTTTFKEYVPFYSYAPRYSQLNKAQLNYYIWWRQNARNGNFIKTDESYVMLYAYELAATGEGEDKERALMSLCSLLTGFKASELGIAYKIMIRDIICDFCLVNRLSPPVRLLCTVERHVLFGSFLSELLIDLSQDKEHCAPLLCSMSLYDYKRSKYYDEQSADVFKRGVNGAISRVMNDPAAFNSITSFTKGVYCGVTEERSPFTRMVNVVNKKVKLEITYYELSNLKTAITDIIRYSENKIREHLGIRNKIHVLTVNPFAKESIDKFFEDELPAQKFIDRRRKDSRASEEAPQIYDKLYDVPRKEISAEHALLIERESWDTTRKLTEAFSDTEDYTEVSAPIAHEEPHSTINKPEEIPTTRAGSEGQNLYCELYSRLGDMASFVKLCGTANALEQRKFALSHNSTPDEIADKINEAAVELFGDIILENDTGAYTVIEEYKFLFE